MENKEYNSANTVVKTESSSITRVQQDTAHAPTGLNEKVWTRSFLILWQGQLVSMMGDVVYAIALGFWVLSVTGSTALMGALMASSTLPGLLAAPFAGVFVDRGNRKTIMIMNDMIRGISVILVGIAGFTGLLQVWMVFAAGVILSFCGAFFSPSVYSVIPDIVPKSKIMNANSVFSMVSLGSSTVGNSAGGFLYQLLGAPLMFLLNGISYIFSGISIIFMKIPQIHKENKRQNFFEDFKDGIMFIWNFKGLRYMVIMGSIISFFFGIVLVLMLPLFQKTASLGPARYGIFMAFFAVGMLLGMLLTSVINIPPARRIYIFILSLFVTEIIFAFIPVFGTFGLMLVLILLGGFTNSFVNVFITSSMQQTIPPDKRGKVFGLFGTVNKGLTPVAMAIGGVLGQFLPISIVISASCILSLLASIPFVFLPSFKRFVNFDPKSETLQDIMQ